MSLSEALTLYCILGGVVGALLRWGFPYLFTNKEKQKEFEQLNPIVAVIFGAVVGYGVAIFFESDLKGVDGVHVSYVKKLGLITAVFVLATIDKLDKFASTATQNIFKNKT
ncbi:hypothetical protein [Shewanella scandinavica]|uniref:hypothetical protein n=1 Tax=Shewanella scandinavica TaxID=3063538 RepID=UPI00319A8EF0